MSVVQVAVPNRAYRAYQGGSPGDTCTDVRAGRLENMQSLSYSIDLESHFSPHLFALKGAVQIS
jgi:hypothetical protein